VSRARHVGGAGKASAKPAFYSLKVRSTYDDGKCRLRRAIRAGVDDPHLIDFDDVKRRTDSR
jgi:hypothetical protein